MMIVMKSEATPDEVRAVVERVESAGARAHVSEGEEVTVIGAVGDREHVQRPVGGPRRGGQVIPILKPYKLASSQFAQGEARSRHRRAQGGRGPFAFIAGRLPSRRSIRP